jgi:hypothetical protein
MSETGLKIKSEKDFWSGIMFIVVGTAFAWGASGYTLGTSARPGPGYFPLGLGVILAVLGVLVTLQAIAFGQSGPPGDRVGAIAWKPLVTIVGSVALFGVLLPHAGALVALPVLVITVSMAGDQFGWLGAAVTAAILTAASWFIFIWGLGLTIPLLPSFMR